jgi:hypothetical protein
VTDKEQIVAVPASLELFTSREKVKFLGVEVLEAICPFMVKNDGEFPDDVDHGPGCVAPCLSFWQYEDKSIANDRHQCKYYVKIADHETIEVMCRGNFKIARQIK